MLLKKPSNSFRLSGRKTREKVVVVGQTRLRIMQQAAYKRLVDRTIKIAPWKRVQFSFKDVSCAACAWKPPVFLTKSHARTFLSIHHMVSSADGGSDEPDNLIILCPNCHSIADYLPSIIVMPVGGDHRSSLIGHLRLLNNDPESWKRQYDIWRTQQKRKAVYALRDADTGYDGSKDVFSLN